jgi:tetratricopeptide (TPR) repeat protein
MDSQTIRTALGLLQHNPEDEQAWKSLKEGAGAPGGELPPEESLGLFDAACEEHRSNGEWDAVAGLLGVELEVAKGTDREPELCKEYALVLHDELLEEARSVDAWREVIRLRPGDEAAARAIQDHENKLGRYQELESSYLAEAENASDDVYQSSMLMRASEVALRFGGPEADQRAVVERLERAVRLDTSNERAAKMLERLYRARGKFEDAGRVLERLADRAETPAARVQAGVRLARLYGQKLGDRERAVRAYTRVLRDDPTHDEAMDFLSTLFSREQRWDELVALYEKQLRDADLGNVDRLGDMLQIAMLYWRKLGRPQDAESWFERIRKLEPGHRGMLDFYREYLGGLGDDVRLINILGGAQRAAKGDQERTRIATELARLAEGQRNAQKAIEQYKSLLRHDPDNREARDALMRLYKQTEGYNALVELLRQQLERTDPKDLETRIKILREVADVYRTFIKSDTALVSVLNQIVQLDE